MANELDIQVALGGYKASVMSSKIGRGGSALQATMSGNYFAEGTILGAITATLIPLGQVVAPHWAYFRNHDATNFVKLRNGSTGADLVKLLAGKECEFPLLDSAVPYAIADTASCLLEYLIFSL